VDRGEEKRDKERKMNETGEVVSNDPVPFLFLDLECY
jgi:hypothetical protein